MMPAVKEIAAQIIAFKDFNDENSAKFDELTDSLTDGLNIEELCALTGIFYTQALCQSIDISNFVNVAQTYKMIRDMYLEAVMESIKSGFFRR